MLKDVRQNKGLSQSQLGEKSGVNVRMIQYYEQGSKDINGARLSTLIDLANALECSIGDIITDNDLKEKLNSVRLV